MANWTMSEVEELRATGKTSSFLPLLVCAVDFDAHDKFPTRFFYHCCPFRLDLGSVCTKSL